jgi:hypothetical protein
MIIAAQPVNPVSGEMVEATGQDRAGVEGMSGFLDTFSGMIGKLNLQPLINAAGTAITPPGTMVQGPGGTIVRQAEGYPAPYIGTGIGINAGIGGVSSGLGTGLMIGAAVLVLFLVMRGRGGS